MGNKEQEYEQKEIEARDKVKTEKEQLTSYLKHQEEKQDELNDSLQNAERELRIAQRKLDSAENMNNQESQIEEENDLLRTQIEDLQT